MVLEMKKISYYKLFIYILLINSFVSLTNTFYPTVLSLGRIVGMILIIVLVAIYIKTLKKRDVFFGFFIIVLDSIALFRIEDATIDLENIIFFTSTTMMLWKFSELNIREKLKKAFKEDSNKFFIFANILLGISIISVFFSSSWEFVNGQRVLYGFCESGHKFSGNLCFIVSIFLLYFVDKKIRILDLTYFGVIFGIILLTGSRTYLISYLLILILLYYKKLRNYNTIKMIMPLIIIIGLYLLINSSIIARFTLMGENTYISDNFWEATSSGRLIWWKIDIEAFADFNFFQKIFGRGFTYLYNLNLTEYGLRISAHNDFITLLISTGLFGLIGYIIILKNWFFKIINKDEKNKKIDVIFTILIFIINAMISGVYGAQQYMFCNIMISLFLMEKNIENGKEKKKSELYVIK